MQLAATDVKIEGDEMIARPVPSRLPASLLASAALHALGLLLAVRFVGSLAGPVELPHAEIIPVSLVSLPGGGGGDKGNGTPAPPPAAPVAAPSPPAPAVPAPPPKPIAAETIARKPPPTKRRARPAPPPVTAPAASPSTAAAPSTASGAGTGHGSSGGGDGSGGDGSGGARAAYRSNPRPPYPLAARRMGIEGRVLLEVVVRPDGSPAAVSVRRSSGSRMLDDSAADTVRSRWRFVPARRDGVPVESTVTVPIRFRISEG